MKTIKVGDTVLVDIHGVRGDRRIGKVDAIYSNVPAGILIRFKTPRYKTYYSRHSLKVITREDDPEYFI
jgi:hypothetical protein